MLGCKYARLETWDANLNMSIKSRVESVFHLIIIYVYESKKRNITRFSSDVNLSIKATLGRFLGHEMHLFGESLGIHFSM